MKRGVGLSVLGALAVCAAIVPISGAQVYPPRWYEEEPGPEEALAPPSLVLADGDLQFPDGTVQLSAAGSGEPLGSPPSPTLILGEGGIEFSDGTVQTTAAGSLVPQTGLTTCFDAGGTEIDCETGIGPGQDGDLQYGVPWPNPRFTINESSPGVPDGTVTDNLTGLVWLRNANCFGTRSWTNALADANGLATGHDCTTDSDGLANLSDGSTAGAWRLPNLRTLHSLVYFAVTQPAVPDTTGSSKVSEGDPFFGVQTAFYWSSTTSAQTAVNSWVVSIGDGSLGVVGKTGTNPYVWPVRDP